MYGDDWTASLSYVLLNGILVYSYTFVSFDKEKFDILNVCPNVVSFFNVKMAEVFLSSYPLESATLRPKFYVVR